jgi:hypothetical protein
VQERERLKAICWIESQKGRAKEMGRKWGNWHFIHPILFEPLENLWVGYHLA